MDENPQETGQGTGSTGGQQRRYGAARVRPRIEVGKPKPAPQGSLTPEVPEPGMGGGDQQMNAPFDDREGGRDPFGPRSFGGGRVRVYGCSPGCLIASVLVSLLLTLFLNALF